MPGSQWWLRAGVVGYEGQVRSVLCAGGGQDEVLVGAVLQQIPAAAHLQGELRVQKVRVKLAQHLHHTEAGTAGDNSVSLRCSGEVE